MAGEPKLNLRWVCKICRKGYKTAQDQLKYRCDGPCDKCGTSQHDLWPVYISKATVSRWKNAKN